MGLKRGGPSCRMDNVEWTMGPSSINGHVGRRKSLISGIEPKET